MERVEVTTVAKARQNRDELASDLLNLLENRRKEAFRHGAKTREAEADQIEVVRMAYNHATDVLNRLEDEERQRAGARQAEAALQLSTTQTTLTKSLTRATWALVIGTALMAVASVAQAVAAGSTVISASHAPTSSAPPQTVDPSVTTKSD